MDLESKLQINLSTYEWSVRIFTILRKLLRVNIKLHQSEGQIRSGDIFLFNHFARFETFIPQYLIYQETGAFCRSVAAANFFTEDSAFSNYLLSIGAVPNNHPRLFPLLATEILKGRKVIIFPEGGMVKDRQVLDSKGRYRVYSPTAGEKRKHHTGAAVLALAVDLFKTVILRLHKAENLEQIGMWAEALGLESAETLLEAARRPTLIVPANITFYPIRVGENILRKGAELLNRRLSRRLSEELLIEGNILLKDTDMDIRLGEPVRPADHRGWWQGKLLTHLVRKTDSLESFFGLAPEAAWWNARLLKWGVRRKAQQIRDEYMQRMYAGVTVNLSHLASRIILTLLDSHQTEVDGSAFHKILYLTVKNVQKEPSVSRHRSLNNPETYGGLLDGECSGLERFLRTSTSMNLIETENGRYRFLPKLLEEHKFHEIRLENLVVVYANEVAPISGVTDAVEQAVQEASAVDDEALAGMRFEDEQLAYAWDKQYFCKARYAEINRQETATKSGEPFLLLPEADNTLGVVLVHGFLASPAEVRSLGEKLAALGYPVMGVRLKGHGTSPWDLRERSWQDWLQSVRRGYAILSAFAERICLIGFSTGGVLSLHLAADRPKRLAGVASICAPLKFRDKNMIFVPLVHGANRLLRSVSSLEGLMMFRAKNSEHPHINYRHMPIRGLYELRRLVEDLEERLPEVRCPVTLIQATEDPIVEPESAELMHHRLGSRHKNLIWIPANRHGILNEDIGNTHQATVSFLASLS